jgi:hypothetical protein
MLLICNTTKHKSGSKLPGILLFKRKHRRTVFFLQTSSRSSIRVRKEENYILIPQLATKILLSGQDLVVP